MALPFFFVLKFLVTKTQVLSPPLFLAVLITFWFRCIQHTVRRAASAFSS